MVLSVTVRPSLRATRGDYRHPLRNLRTPARGVQVIAAIKYADAVFAFGPKKGSGQKPLSENGVVQSGLTLGGNELRRFNNSSENKKRK